jgi:DNA-binding MarR family transcriptional regulator
MAKREVLTLLAQMEDLDAAAIAQHVGKTPEAARMLLLRLTRQGLVRRAWDPNDRVLFYALTVKGRARWRYLTEGHDKTFR